MNQNSPERSVELVAIINSFNRRSLLEDAVASLTNALRSVPFASAIVVFEAGSNDGSAEFLRTWREHHPADNLIVIEASADRRSFSAGVNAACADAIGRFPKCRWLFLYETDNCLTSAEPLEKAIALLELEPQLAAAGFTVKQYDGKFFGYGMRFPTALSFALGQNLAGQLNLHRPNNSAWRISDGVRWRTCDVVFTSPLLVRREAWEQSGGFDEKNFPFSDVDLDWAWRCAKLGWKMAVIASDNVVHDNRRQLSAWSANRALDFHRNRFGLLKRHRGKHVALLKPLLFLRHCLEAIILARKSATDPVAKEKLAKRKQMLRTVWSNYS
ncbi:MAG TPA: glycosyltransferase [Chthoniobacterales bacterium]|nr:glycosyltransferase [Chthoniobacterales bacterium]